MKVFALTSGPRLDEADFFTSLDAANLAMRKRANEIGSRWNTGKPQFFRMIDGKQVNVDHDDRDIAVGFTCGLGGWEERECSWRIVTIDVKNNAD